MIREQQEDIQLQGAVVIEFQVRCMPSGSYGVFADSVLIAEHMTLSQSEAHCQRLLEQQALQ